MVTVSLCCCYFKLETGGKIIGFYNLIQSLLLFIASTAYIFYFYRDCEEAKIYMYKYLFCSYDNYLSTSVFGMLLCSLCCWISYMCIKGTKNRNHTQLELMLYMLGISIYLKIVRLFFRFSGILVVALECYEFVVIYSLHKKFREESSMREDEPTQTDSNDMTVV